MHYSDAEGELQLYTGIENRKGISQLVINSTFHQIRFLDGVSQSSQHQNYHPHPLRGFIEEHTYIMIVMADWGMKRLQK